MQFPKGKYYNIGETVMDKPKEVEKQLNESKARVAKAQQELQQGTISPEDAIHECMRAFEAVGEVLKQK